MVYLSPLRLTRAQGRPGIDRYPWSACSKKHAAEPQVQPISGLPCAMVLRLIRALLGAPGFLATVSHNALTRVMLDTSVGVSGPHDFTVRHRISHPAQKRLTRQRPSHSLSNVRDDAYAPHPDRNAQTIRLILRFSEAIYFSQKGLQASRALKGLVKLDFGRKRIWQFRR